MGALMRVAVAGGTGLLGRHVVAALGEADHEAVVLSRGTGVDLVAGTSLGDALAGVEVIVDVTDLKTASRKASAAFFTSVGRNLLAAGQRAGAGHYVALSIVGSDKINLGYYEGKRRQEELALSGLLPGTVLRSTQFHEFPSQILGQIPGPVAAVPRMRMQPIAAREVADALVAQVGQEPAGLLPELAGPRPESLVELARLFVRTTGMHKRVVPIRWPGAAGKAWAAGAAIPVAPGPRGRQTFAQWLSEFISRQRLGA